MERQHPDAVIGIDGGGTHCRFALCLEGRRIGWQAGSANAQSDLTGTRRILRDGLAALAQKADLPLSTLADIPAFIGLAGVLSGQVADDLARDLPLRHVRVEDDRRSAMRGALGDFDGVVLGVGTGSFLGRRSGGQERLIGGWGLILGDDASGAWLGRGILRAAVQVTDGLEPRSPLTDRLLTDMGGAAGIVAFAATAQPLEFARLAPEVVAAAGQGDASAVTLMRAGAGYIATGLRGLGWQTGERICPLGGVAPHYAPYLPSEIAACLTAPEGTALDGALALARQIPVTGDVT